jgi:MtN3 and saliva related transmembrane protein
MYFELIGLTAACLTMFGFVPQLIKAHRFRSTEDISLISLLQFSLGVSLWIIYGIFIKNAIIVLANSVTLLTLILLLATFFKFARRSE